MAPSGGGDSEHTSLSADACGTQDESRTGRREPKVAPFTKDGAATNGHTVPVLAGSAFLEDRTRFSVVTPDGGLKLARMDERALIRAAEITLRRAILANFPPERQRRLKWVDRAVSSRQEARRALKLLTQRDPVHLCPSDGGDADPS
jgi:hypothetical protein